MTNANAVAAAHDTYVDRRYDEYYRDYEECPYCGAESLDGESGKTHRGWWSKSWCTESDCDYEYSDWDTWD